MNNQAEETSWFKKYRLPLMLGVVAICFYFAGMYSVFIKGG